LSGCGYDHKIPARGFLILIKETIENAMAAKLSVNLNAVAVLRNRRNLPWPSLVHLGGLALDAGACGLTVHPRPDQRHVRYEDLDLLRDLTAGRSAEFNVEGYPTEEFLELVIRCCPDQVTLVPDDPAQNTSDHGWDFVKHRQLLERAIQKLRGAISRVSLFCDPDASLTQIRTAKQIGADRIELYTGPYGATFDDPRRAQLELEKLKQTARFATEERLGLNAGHDLTVGNLPDLIESIPNLMEVSIGHALIAEAIEYGISETVGRFRQAAQGIIP
jgi:pyridoxine 5-phosphate synthase